MLNMVILGVYDREWFGTCFLTEDQKEGMGTFLEKRRANFKNK